MSTDTVVVPGPDLSFIGLPNTAVIAESTERLYVFATAVTGAGGDGILVVGAESLVVEDFIPLSGLVFAEPGSIPTPLVLPFRRPGLALSRDERLLFVAAGDRLVVINVLTNRVVPTVSDLPAPLLPVSQELEPTEALAARLEAIRTIIGTRRLVDLAVSDDGRSLYAVLADIAQERAAILPINIDTGTDGDYTFGLQSDLSRFLTTGPPRLAETNGRPAQVEPSDIAVNPATGHVYLADGGWRDFIGVPSVIDNNNRYVPLVSADLTGAGSGAAGSLEIEQALNILDKNASDGYTLLNAPGFIETFASAGAPGALGSQVGQFPSEVVFAWRPPVADGGRIVNQIIRPKLYAKRPKGLALRPDGKRALVVFAQTGNIGVLDSDTEPLFPGAVPGPDGFFYGLAGVTEAIPLDPHLWPKRGVVSLPSGSRMPSRDEALLFPTSIRYAQNGKFAVAVHQGTRKPDPASVRMPDWVNDPRVRQDLAVNGFILSAMSPTGTDPFGQQVTVGQEYLADRGGGALTIIDDDAITTGLGNAARPIQLAAANGWPPSQFAKCTRMFRAPAVSSSRSVRSSRTSPQNTSSGAQFDHPQDVAIQPFVSIESPRFGDHIFWTTPFSVRWHDPTVTALRLSVTDLSSGAEYPPNVVPLSAPTRARQAVTLPFSCFFQEGDVPPPGLFRLTVVARSSSGDISSISIRVRF